MSSEHFFRRAADMTPETTQHRFTLDDGFLCCQHSDRSRMLASIGDAVRSRAG